jgi:hypothetical protein
MDEQELLHKISVETDVNIELLADIFECLEPATEQTNE